ncbi:MAG: hypothetical protein RMJ53_01750 [Chitinophagales bacterium]|nr:hypothetical protein [Chitinophagales bacterium]MDW8272933.1 hypothetical protein [Chitinophagales bacterium]
MKLIFEIILLLALIAAAGCKDKNNNNNNNIPNPPIGPDTEVKGYGLLSRLSGIWSGNIESNTALGNFPDYTVDYRPVSPAQVSAKNEMDSLNDLFMSFFITRYDGKYLLAFRNGGSFAGMQRISYLMIDSVSESSNTAFYRFKDFVKGTSRTYADLTFRNDSLLMFVYTNKYNTSPTPVMHFKWYGAVRDRTTAQQAISKFSFPKKQLAKDLSDAFKNKNESIFYNAAEDVYKETDHPYLGRTRVNVSYGSSLTPDPSKKVFLIITTQPLFNGFVPNLANLKYRSRYVVLKGNTAGYNFNYMHPGEYYIYALYDSDGNFTFNSGDYISSNLNQSFTLGEKEDKTVSVKIDFRIP